MSSPPPVSVRKLGLIGGSSFLESAALSSFTPLVVETPFGSVVVRTNADQSVVFVQRHGADPHPERKYSPPHLINYRAIAKALQQLNVSHVLAFGSTGSLKKTLPIGQLLVPDDWIHFSPITTFGYDKGGHGGTGLDEGLRANLLSLLRSNSYNVLDTGVYAQTLGPRFETPAEIRSLAIQGGDIVGMTCAHEATLCKELGLPYALVCIIDNMANGVSGTDLSYEEFHAGVARNLATMEKILGLVLEKFAPATDAMSASPTPSPTAESNKISVDQLVHARWIVPVEPPVVHEHHTLVIKEGVIIDLLPTAEAKHKYAATHEEDFPDSTLMPGFVNAHSHLGMSLMRGYADDHCLSEWLTKHIWPGEAVFVSPEYVRDSCELGLAEMLRGGTTACNDMYFFPEVTADLVDKVGTRAVIGLTTLDFPTAYASTHEEYLTKGLKLYEAMKHHPRLQFSVAPHAPYTVCDANLLELKRAAEQVVLRNPTQGLPNDEGKLSVPARMHVHLHETRSEVEDSATLTPSMACHRSVHKCRPMANFDKNLNLVNENLIAVHMTQLTEEEIARLAETKASTVHCPTSNLKLASGFSPLAKLNKAKVNVALGTDSTASNNGLDMFSEMKLAAIVGKAVADDSTACPAYDVLRMATINGARALGIDAVTGSLEVGKSADFISVHMDELETLPLFSIISHLVYVSCPQHVQNVWVAGKRLMRNRQLLTLDEKDIKRRAAVWQIKMAAEKAKQAAERLAQMEDTAAEAK